MKKLYLKPEVVVEIFEGDLFCGAISRWDDGHGGDLPVIDDPDDPLPPANAKWDIYDDYL